VARLNRRQFLGVTAVAGAGLGLGIGWRLANDARKITPASPLAGSMPTATTNAWIRITPENLVTITISRSEMGQGVETALAMIVAEELDADWANVRTRWAPADAAYGNQHTAASSSIRQMWQPLREVAGTARHMLIAAAAQMWNVPAGDCRAENSVIMHPDERQTTTFGAVTNRAASLPIPVNVDLKAPDKFRIVGRRMPRLDTPKKVDGSAVFGWDVQIPEMLIAAITRCPVNGGRLADYDTSDSMAIKGVHAVVEVTDPYAPTHLFSSGPPIGLAVVADDYWSAQLGKKALKVTWDVGPNAEFDTATITRMLAEWAAGNNARTVVDRGDVTRFKEQSNQQIHAIYETPYLAHMTMSPMCCTADLRDDSCEVWAPTQSPDLAVKMVKKYTGLSRESITINKTYLGGGFGRRQRQDYVGEAVQISSAMRRPIKVLWSREEDVQHDFYRPMSYDVINAWLDDAGYPLGWRHRIASTEEHVLSSGGVDAIPYDIPNKYVDLATPGIDQPVRVSTWRGVSHSQNAFVVECFLDELAYAGGHDPYAYRRHLLRKSPRYLEVIDLVATYARWGEPLREGVHRGIAMDESGESIAAQVVEISIDDQQTVKVHRVVCAVDCGLVINPDGVEAQIEGAIIDGLTAALYSEITIKEGRVQQSNFHDYPVLRMNQVPEIEVHIVQRTSAEHIGGAGEVGLPPLAPALANAVFAATGKRIRKLPIRLDRT